LELLHTEEFPEPAQQQKRVQCWLRENALALQAAPARRTYAVMLRDLNVSSKTMNQNLENAYAIAFGLGHCEQTAGRQCSSIARDQSASVTFRKRTPHPLLWR